MKLHGVHHVSAITGNVQENYNFYTKILGLKLIKNTIHHEDETARKLYYANSVRKDGTCLSFIERKQATETVEGNNKIIATSLRVPSDESLDFWKKRFSEQSVVFEDVVELGGNKALPFQDFEGHNLFLISSEEDYHAVAGESTANNTIPFEHKIFGLGPTMITVSNEEDSTIVLQEVLSLKKVGKYRSPISHKSVNIFSMEHDSLKNEIHLQVSNELTQGKTGYGSIHHIALRVKNIEELREWRDLFERIRMPNSGIVNHLYYRSIYFRDGNGILYELATDEPGFTVDEERDQLGTTLSLPRSLKRQREKIEKKLTPLITTEPQ